MQIRHKMDMMCISQCIVMVLVVFLPVHHAYLPEEMECPDRQSISEELFFPNIWIPPGTPNRAMQTMPPQFEAKLSALAGRGIGVFSRTFVSSNTFLSEFEGEYVPIELADDRETYDYAWRVRADGEDDRLIDALDESLANWLRYVNCGRSVMEENVEMLMCYGRAYFRTTKDIPPHQELLIYCGEEYSETYLHMTKEEYYNHDNKSGDP